MNEDSQVATIIKKHLDRAEKGYVKYGVTTDRTDLTPVQWLNHLIEELMDATIYAQKLISEIERLQDSVTTLDKILGARISRCVKVEKELGNFLKADPGCLKELRPYAHISFDQLRTWQNFLGKPHS